MSRRWRTMGLRAKLIAGSVGLIIALTLAMSLLVLYRVKGAQEDEIEKRGQALCKELARLSEFPLRSGDDEALGRLADEALLGEDVLAVEIRALDSGELVQRARRTPPERKRPFSCLVLTRKRSYTDPVDLLDGGASGNGVKEVGSVRVWLSLAAAERMLREMAIAMAVVGLALAGIAILISVQFARRITGPLMSLAGEVEKIGDGRFDARVEVVEDGELAVLSERFNQMAERLELSVERMAQQEKMAGLGRMASGIAHEIGSPLSSIMIDAGDLANKLPDGGERESAEDILFQARKMRDIVTNLLEFARKPPAELAPVDLGQALGEATKVLAHPLRKSSLEIAREIPKDLPPLRGVKNLAVQVFVNLIQNALEATGEKGTLTVKARVDDDGEKIVIEFIDNGPGIPEDVLPLLFDPFFTTREESGGAGLGLAICDQIMRGLGGSIGARNLEAGGCAFSLEFKRF